jgi:hypothetical protein
MFRGDFQERQGIHVPRTGGGDPAKLVGKMSKVKMFPAGTGF